MKCPICDSEKITRSNRRGFENYFRYIYPFSPYRCKECWSRFWIFESPFNTLLAKVLAGGVILILLFIITLPFVPYDQFLKDKEPDRITQNNVVDDNELPRLADESSTSLPQNKIKKQTPKHEDTVDKNKEEKDQQQLIVADAQTSTDSTKSQSVSSEAPKDETTAVQPSVPSVKEDKIIPEIKPLDRDQLKTDKIKQPENIKPIAKPKSIRHKTVAKNSKVTYRQLKKITHKASEDKFEILIHSPDRKKINQYKHFFMVEYNIPKVVIDLPGKWKDRMEKSIINVESNIVQRIRVGEHSNYIRVVMDLKVNENMTPTFIQSAEGLWVAIQREKEN